jgi:hypothetical protein
MEWNPSGSRGSKECGAGRGRRLTIFSWCNRLGFINYDLAHDLYDYALEGWVRNLHDDYL